MGAFEELGQLRAQGLAVGGVERRVVELTGASVGGLVVIGLRSGGFELGDAA